MRLIDADELIATITFEIETKSLMDRRNLFDIIDNAPTIEAEICGENHCPLCGAKEDEV